MIARPIGSRPRTGSWRSPPGVGSAGPQVRESSGRKTLAGIQDAVVRQVEASPGCCRPKRYLGAGRARAAADFASVGGNSPLCPSVALPVVAQIEKAVGGAQERGSECTACVAFAGPWLLQDARFGDVASL